MPCDKQELCSRDSIGESRPEDVNFFGFGAGLSPVVPTSKVARTTEEKADEYVCTRLPFSSSLSQPRKGGEYARIFHRCSRAHSHIGNLNGALSSLSATALGSCVIQEVVRRTAIESRKIDEVIMGNVLSAGLGQAPGRQAAKGAGLPDSVDATTISLAKGDRS